MIFVINTSNIFCQINDIFPYITLGMEYKDFKDKVYFKSGVDYGFYFGDIKIGDTSGFFLDEPKRPKVQFVNFITIFDFFQAQGYHFNNDKLVGCSAHLYFFNSMFDTGPIGYDFDKVYNELLKKVSRLFGEFIIIYDDYINRESLHKIPVEIQSGMIIPGRNYSYNYLTLRSIDINENKLYLAYWNIDKIPEWEQDLRIPRMYIYYGTEYFYNDFSNDFYSFGEN